MFRNRLAFYALGFTTFLVVSLSGCSSLISRAGSDMADNLSRVMLDHDDPDTVREAAPAYLLMSDSLLARDPDNPRLLIAAARLYSAYAGVFVDNPARARRLTGRALDYARHAACLQHPSFCDRKLSFDRFMAGLARFETADLPVLYTLGTSWAVWIRARSTDWNAIAELPRVTAIMQRILELDETYENGMPHLYLGISYTLLPAALGGKPQLARRHFERVIALSQGRNLAAKVEYARRYARLVFDRVLHDRLLNEVLQADPAAPGMTLSNVLAQRDARALLADADDYF